MIGDNPGGKEVGYQSTYKELKPLTSKGTSVGPVTSYQSTYKELKLPYTSEWQGNPAMLLEYL